MSSGPAFSGTLSLTGANAADFQLSSTTLPANLELNTTLANGTYNLNIVATQGGISNSPFSAPQVITGQTALFPTTMTLVNDGGSTQAANVPSKLFGWGFRDGDIAPGAAPIFTVSSVVQPFSAGLQAYWPSGCLKFATFMLLPTFSLGAGASQAITISGGGTWPASTGWTVPGVIDPQNVLVNAPPYSSSYNARSSSNIVSVLKSTDPNLYRTVKWLDGAAGTAWWFSTNMAATAGGSADGQLICDHYIIALNTNASSPALGGFRWLGAIRQPKYNNDTPAKRFVFFVAPNNGTPTAGTNWQSVGPGGSGTTTTPLTWPFAAQTFTNGATGTGTISSGGVLTITVTTGLINIGGGMGNITGSGITAGACYVASQLTGPAGGTGTYQLGGTWPTIAIPQTINAYDQNSFNTLAANGWSTDNNNVIPCVLTGGSLPPTSTTPATNSGAWANTGFVFGYTAGTPTLLNAAYAAGITGGFSYSFTDYGSGTITPVPGLWSFNRIMFANQDAEYNFFQGTGSLSADTTLRAQINQAYWSAVKFVAPFDLTLNGSTFGGVISDTTYSYNWNPYCIQYFNQDQSGVGNHTDIGMYPNIAAVEFYNQSKISLKSVRIVGLSAALQIFDFKDATTDTIVRLDNPSNPSYTGLPASSVAATVNWQGLGSGGGFTPPPEGSGSIGFNTSISEHEPNYSWWAYLRTGELQYLHFITEIANGQLLVTGNEFRNPTPASSGVTPASYGVQMFYGEFRAMGWAGRDQQQAAFIYPWNPTAPTALDYDGTQTGKYLNDIADVSANFPMNQFNSGAAVYGSQNSYIQSAYFWIPALLNYSGSGLTTYQNNGYVSFEVAIAMTGMIHAYLRGNTLAGDWLALMINRWNYIGTHYAGSSTGGSVGAGNPNGYTYIYAGGNTGLWVTNNPALGINYPTTAPLSSNTGLSPCVGADAQWFPLGDTDGAPWQYSGGSPQLKWRPNSLGTPAFFWSGTPGSSYVPANGDIFTPDLAFYGDGGPTVLNYPPELNANQSYYMVGLTGTLTSGAFDLSASPGGSPVAITSSTQSLGSAMMHIFGFAPSVTEISSYQGNGTEWWLQVRQAARWLYAIDSVKFAGALTVVNDANYRLANATGGPFPTYNTLVGSPEPIDARYCLAA